MIVGLDPLNSAAKGQVRTIIAPDPRNGGVYTLDDATRTANPSPRFMYDLAVGGGGTYALPLGGPRSLRWYSPEPRGVCQVRARTRNSLAVSRWQVLSALAAASLSRPPLPRPGTPLP